MPQLRDATVRACARIGYIVPGYTTTMPFKSKRQMQAAYAGSLGSLMKNRAAQWARETPNIKDLPERASKNKARKKKK
jgi:hypothetical protein